MILIKHNIVNIPIWCLFIAITLMNSNVHSQNDKKGTLLENHNNPSTFNILIGDTVKTPLIEYDKDYMPGLIKKMTNDLQDSNYSRALRLRIPSSVRIMNDLKMFSNDFSYFGNIDKDPYEIIRKNMAVPTEVYIPLKSEQTMYQYGLMQSQYIPFVRTMNPFGLKIPLSSIGQFLGITEDVSPVLKYSLDVRTNVNVVVYSISASVVATIIDEVQPPGDYKYTWNGRDDMGKKLSSGDYIGEIRIGNTKYIRKRIVIP